MTPFEEQLKDLQKIKPDQGFAMMCREDILSSTANIKPSIKLDIWRNLGLTFSLALTTLLIVFISNNAALSSYSIANMENFAKETELSQEQINITIAEINYHSDLASKTALALSEASAEGPAHLNQSLLMKELQDLKLDSQNTDIESLLDQAIL